MTDENLTPRPRFVDVAPSFPPEGPVVREVRGRIVVEYPAGRPEWFACSPGVIEALVDEVNRERSRPHPTCGPDVVVGASWVCGVPCDRPSRCPLAEVPLDGVDDVAPGPYL